MNMDCISLATEDEGKQPKLLACGMDEFCQVFEIGSDSYVAYYKSGAGLQFNCD